MKPGINEALLVYKKVNWKPQIEFNRSEPQGIQIFGFFFVYFQISSFTEKSLLLTLLCLFSQRGHRVGGGKQPQ